MVDTDRSVAITDHTVVVLDFQEIDSRRSGSLAARGRTWESFRGWKGSAFRLASA